MSRRRRERELPEFASAARRFIRRTGERVADADPEDLAELLALRAEVEAAIQVAVDGQRDRFSWSEIARGLGITRQGAHKQYARARLNLSA